MEQCLKNRLRVWRVDHGLTQEECCDISGVSVPMWSRVERGERQFAPLTKVKVARRLGVPVHELFEVEELDEAPSTRDGR